MYLQGHWRELIGLDAEDVGKERLQAMRERLMDSAMELLAREGIDPPVVNRGGGKASDQKGQKGKGKGKGKRNPFNAFAARRAP